MNCCCYYCCCCCTEIRLYGVGGRWVKCEGGELVDWQWLGKTEELIETCRNVFLSITNPSLTGLGSKPDLRNNSYETDLSRARPGGGGGGGGRKGTGVPVLVMNTRNRNGFTAPFILHRGTLRRWKVSHNPRPLYPREKIPVTQWSFAYTRAVFWESAMLSVF
jgi:hypothetical protein